MSTEYIGLAAILMFAVLMFALGFLLGWVLS